MKSSKMGLGSLGDGDGEVDCEDFAEMVVVELVVQEVLIFRISSRTSGRGCSAVQSAS